MNVKVNDKEIEILNFIVRDPVLVAAFNDAIKVGKSAEDYLVSILRLGSQVSSLSSASAGVETLEASIGQARETIEQISAALQMSIKKQVEDFAADDGLFLRNVEQVVNNLKANITELTTGEDSPVRQAVVKGLTEVQAKIKEDFSQQVSAQRTDLAILLNPSDPTSPLRVLSEKIDNLSQVVSKVQSDLSKEVAIAEVLETGIFGGLAYEELAIKAIQTVASFAGDDCESTGTVTGRVPRSKMGDGVVDLKVGATVYARVVVEAKNKSLSKLEWERESQGSKENRGATGFIGLCKHLNDMPNGNRILILDSQSIVMAFDPENDDPQFLALVYQLVKLNTISSSGQFNEVNAAEINKNLEDAFRSLEKFDNITKSASAIRNSSDAITKEANSLRGALSESIQAAQNAISRSLESTQNTPAILAGPSKEGS